ncbi:hypothetical protein GCM10027168_63450 [Streptomyces capparidis]
MLRQCLDGGAAVAEMLPTVTVNGVDVGRWLEQGTRGRAARPVGGGRWAESGVSSGGERQPTVWTKLQSGQREGLEKPGTQPAAREQARGAADGTATSAAKAAPAAPTPFQRGVEALRRSGTEKGHVHVPHGHVEARAADGDRGGGGQEGGGAARGVVQRHAHPA